MNRLAIISTHPIQYNAPLFRLLSERNKLYLKVFYTWSQSESGKIFDPGFGIEKKWDIPLLEGYDHCFVQNVSTDPGSHHYKGVINPTLIREIENFQPNAVLVYGWSFHSHLQAMRYFKGRIPVYFRGDSTLIDEPKGFNVKKILRRLFLKWVYRHVDKAFYAGENNKAYYLKHALKSSQLVFLPHAIENKRFANKKKPERNYREELGIPLHAICILFAGKLEVKKDPMLLLECFLELDLPDTFLVFVGNGKLEGVLQQRAHANSAVLFLPFQNQNDMPAVYAMCDLFVLPSKGPAETWGLAVNEAMASSKPVLVSDKCGCYPDLVKPGLNGDVFHAGDQTQLKNQLATLLTGKALKRMGLRSESFIDKWSFENCAAIIEDEING